MKQGAGWSKEMYDAILLDLRKLWPSASPEEQKTLDRLITWYVRRRNKAYPNKK